MRIRVKKKVPSDIFIYFLASFPKSFWVVVTCSAKKILHRGNITIAGEKLQNVGNMYPFTQDMARVGGRFIIRREATNSRLSKSAWGTEEPF